MTLAWVRNKKTKHNYGLAASAVPKKEGVWENSQSAVSGFMRSVLFSYIHFDKIWLVHGYVATLCNHNASRHTLVLPKDTFLTSEYCIFLRVHYSLKGTFLTVSTVLCRIRYSQWTLYVGYSIQWILTHSDTGSGIGFWPMSVSPLVQSNSWVQRSSPAKSDSHTCCHASMIDDLTLRMMVVC